MKSKKSMYKVTVDGVPLNNERSFKTYHVIALDISEAIKKAAENELGAVLAVEHVVNVDVE